MSARHSQSPSVCVSMQMGSIRPRAPHLCRRWSATAASPARSCRRTGWGKGEAEEKATGEWWRDCQRPECVDRVPQGVRKPLGHERLSRPFSADETGGQLSASGLDLQDGDWFVAFALTRGAGQVSDRTAVPLGFGLVPFHFVNRQSQMDGGRERRH